MIILSTFNTLFPALVSLTSTFLTGPYLPEQEGTRSPQETATEVFGSNGSVGGGHFVRYSRKSVNSGFFNAKFQFGDGKNVRYS